MSKKRQITQDELKGLLNSYHFKRVRLAELTGLSEASLNVCFEHKPGRTGKPRSFTADAVERINQALPQIADGIRDCLLVYGSGKVEKNNRGNEYDRGMRELINNNIGRYLNITLMVDEVLGWNQKKKEAILGSSSKASGNITKEHVQAINQHLLNIYGNLSAIELVADSDSSSSSDNGEDTEA